MLSKPPFKVDLQQIKYEYLACFVCMLLFVVIVALQVMLKH